MGVIKPKYTIPVPENATIRGNAVSWIDKHGKKKTGKMTGSGRVQVEASTWQIRYRDEHNQERRESTKMTSKASALKLLAVRQSEVERIALGVASREELVRAENRNETLTAQLDLFKNRMFASGAGEPHIEATRNKIDEILSDTGIQKIREISQESIETWIADQRRVAKRSPRTINSYLIALNSFMNWAVDTGRLLKNPLKKVKKLNEAVDRRKNRRSLTDSELEALFRTARNRKHRHKKRREEIELVYRVLVGTGLRSTELSLAVPVQFDFEKNRFTVKAAKTKNKKEDSLPIRPDLAARLKNWIEKNEIGPKDRIFSYDKHSIYRSFRSDCETAGIKLIGDDGRSVDVHSLRRTFGTMLARAGVPLTTTQRLMRHSTPELTAKLYIDVEPIDMMQAVAKLPAFDEEKDESGKDA